MFTLCNAFSITIHFNIALFFVGIGDYQHSFSEHLTMKVEELNLSIRNQSKNDNEIREKLKNMIQFRVMIEE